MTKTISNTSPLLYLYRVGAIDSLNTKPPNKTFKNIHHGCDLLQWQVLVRLVGLIDIAHP